MIKFRTMWRYRARLDPMRDIAWLERIDDEAGPELKGPDDHRAASHLARFCRRHSIDELPQLFHVLLGEMSLVGSRPVTRPESQRIYGPDARGDSAREARCGGILAGVGPQSTDARGSPQAGSRVCAEAVLESSLWDSAEDRPGSTEWRQYLVRIP
ncbi:MAG: sugar transferase [Acidobacteriia bacterium]|nr:sugar transferase [Terriglobia bacterium]